MRRRIWSRKLRLRRFLLAVSVTCFCLVPASGYAAILGVGAHEHATHASNSDLKDYGVRGWNTSASTPSYIRKHVSSLYYESTPYKSARAYAEIGVFRLKNWGSYKPPCSRSGQESINYQDYDDGRPYLFTAFHEDGKQQCVQVIFAVTDSQSIQYSLINIRDGGTNKEFRWYSGGSSGTLTHRRTEVLPLMVDGGWPMVYSERDCPNDDPNKGFVCTQHDSNYSHFWTMKKRDSSGNWSAWTDASSWNEDEDEYFDNDPDYSIRTGDGGQSELYVYWN